MLPAHLADNIRKLVFYLQSTFALRTPWRGTQGGQSRAREYLLVTVAEPALA